MYELSNHSPTNNGDLRHNIIAVLTCGVWFTPPAVSQLFRNSETNHRIFRVCRRFLAFVFATQCDFRSGTPRPSDAKNSAPGFALRSVFLRPTVAPSLRCNPTAPLAKRQKAPPNAKNPSSAALNGRNPCKLRTFATNRSQLQ